MHFKIAAYNHSFIIVIVGVSIITERVCKIHFAVYIRVIALFVLSVIERAGQIRRVIVGKFHAKTVQGKYDLAVMFYVSVIVVLNAPIVLIVIIVVIEISLTIIIHNSFSFFYNVFS